MVFNSTMVSELSLQGDIEYSSYIICNKIFNLQLNIYRNCACAAYTYIFIIMKTLVLAHCSYVF